MQTFVSWSGDRSRSLAAALHDWLPSVIEEVEPWMSSHDIHVGEDWRKELDTVLDQADAGVICLTPENVEAEWVLWEAGAISRHDRLVCPLLLELDEASMPDPLRSLQAVSATEAGSRRLIGSLNRALGEVALERAELDRRFEERWPALEADIGEARHASVGEQTSKAAVMDRGLSSALDGLGVVTGRYAGSQEPGHRAALQLALEATRSTLQQLAARDGDVNEASQHLSELWEGVGMALLDAESSGAMSRLARRCFLKSQYWASPERWTWRESQQEAEASSIRLEQLSEDLLRALTSQ